MKKKEFYDIQRRVERHFKIKNKNNKIDDRIEHNVNTEIGIMKIIFEYGKDVSSVFIKFSEVDKANKKFENVDRLNEFSGKYNFHSYDYENMLSAVTYDLIDKLKPYIKEDLNSDLSL